jgi:hypothetical protein
MAKNLEDAEIARLIRLRKELPKNWERRLRRIKADRDFKHLRSSIIIQTDEGQFRISLRQGRIDKADFSVVLGFLSKAKDSRWFRLKRYNGLHPPLGFHRNRIEKTRIHGFHIHTATLRYQQRTPKEEGFAEPSTAYVDLWTALTLMIAECGFVKPAKPDVENDQLPLFRTHGDQR